MKAYAQIKAIEANNKKRILAICPFVCERSGIYVFFREDSGIKYAYVGQAKHLLTRLAQHLGGYEQHIDRSIKKHKLWDSDNPTGYKIRVYVLYYGRYLSRCDAGNVRTYVQQGDVFAKGMGYALRNGKAGQVDL